MNKLPPPEISQQVVEALLGPITWLSPTEGFCECPGKGNHTTRNGVKDCKVYLGGTPTVTCFHSGCREAIHLATQQLRESWRANSTVGQPVKIRMTAEENARVAAIRQKEALRRRTASAAPRLFAENRWSYADICSDSPTPLPNDDARHWEALLQLYDDDDVIWIGNVCDSGQPHHRSHFRSKREWLERRYVSGQFTCPSAFRPSTHSRSNDNVEARRFLVVESDTLSKDMIGSVFRWLDHKAGLTLRAIVDTAGKSLHGWFKYPGSEELANLKVILPELGCDPKMFNASQPCRLPGARRGEKLQRLIYLHI